MVLIGVPYPRWLQRFNLLKKKKKGIPVMCNKIIKPGVPVNTTLSFVYNRLKYQRALKSKYHVGLACLTKPGRAPSPDGSVGVLVVWVWILHFPTVILALGHRHLSILDHCLFHVIHEPTVSFTVIVIAPFFHDYVRLCPRAKQIYKIVLHP